MKKLLIFFCLLFAILPPAVKAQTFAEWFKQKKTQKQYLVQQIAALQVYKGAIKKGYEIVDDGLKVVSDLKDGEFSLHKDYFDQLSRASPFVKQYPKIATVQKHYRIVYELYEQSLRMATSSDAFSSNEYASIRSTWAKVLDDCHLLIEDLENICQDGTLEMSDARRTEHIDRIHDEMESNVSFAHTFALELLAVRQGRDQAHKDIQRIRLINGLNN